MRIRLWIWSIVLMSAPVLANSGGAPAGETGAPGESTCAQCHGNGSLNSGGGALQIQLGDVTNWTPGQSIKIKVTLSDPTASRWGFELTARSASNPNTKAGSFMIIDNTNQLKTAGGLEFVTHTSGGTRPGTSGASSWEVQWTPPADAGFGDVTFYAAGNAANASGTADFGDKIYTTNLTVSPGAPATGLTRVLPQLAFGSDPDLGNWSTAVYVHNTTGSPAQVPVSFFGITGAPLDVPNLGSSTTVNLGPRGTAIVDIPSLGPLTQGSIQVQTPDGVVGYAIFRQASQGVNPQEGVVPFSSSTSQLATLVFDETGFVTAAAVLNPTQSTVTVTITARDEAGNVLGTLTLTLAARERQAFVLRDKPELTTMNGKRGSVDFSAPSGAVSVLGLRFNGLAFTSILPAER